MKLARTLVGIVLVAAGLGVVSLCLSAEPAPHNPSWLQEMTVVKDLRIAIGNYVLDHRGFPGQRHQSQFVDQRALSTGALIDCLIGENREWNPRAIPYILLPPAKNGKSGHIPANGNTAAQLVDMWGSPYVILLDTSGDDAIANPDLKNGYSQMVRRLGEPPPVLKMDVAVFSLGKDKEEGTDDDIVSWRTWGAEAYEGNGWQRWTEVGIVGAVVGAVLAWFHSRRFKGRDASSAAVS